MEKGREARTELVIISFLCEPSLKDKFKVIIKENGFSTLTEAFREQMRKTVDNYELKLKGDKNGF